MRYLFCRRLFLSGPALSILTSQKTPLDRPDSPSSLEQTLVILKRFYQPYFTSNPRLDLSKLIVFFSIFPKFRQEAVSLA